MHKIFAWQEGHVNKAEMFDHLHNFVQVLALGRKGVKVVTVDVFSSVMKRYYKPHVNLYSLLS